jgi:hypothetical protein
MRVKTNTQNNSDKNMPECVLGINIDFKSTFIYFTKSELILNIQCY